MSKHADPTKARLLELWREEESLRHAFMHSEPVVYAEKTAVRLDSELFKAKPYERYAVGMLLGLFISKVFSKTQ
jgi:hypothetical protein